MSLSFVGFCLRDMATLHRAGRFGTDRKCTVIGADLWSSLCRRQRIQAIKIAASTALFMVQSNPDRIGMGCNNGQ